MDLNNLHFDRIEIQAERHPNIRQSWCCDKWRDCKFAHTAFTSWVSFSDRRQCQQVNDSSLLTKPSVPCYTKHFGKKTSLKTPYSIILSAFESNEFIPLYQLWAHNIWFVTVCHLINVEDQNWVWVRILWFLNFCLIGMDKWHERTGLES